VTTSDDDEILQMVREAIHHFLSVKRRLPLLKALFRELDRLKDIEGGKLRLRNDAVWQMMLDTNSMLVNDLYSIRERLVKKKDAIINSLRDHLTRFKVFQPTPDPNHPGALITLPEEMESQRASIEQSLEDDRNRLVAESLNEGVQALFHKPPPITEQDLKALVKRINKDTEPLGRDRNLFRAHPFEKNTPNPAGVLLNLEQIEQQMSVIEEILFNLFLVLSEGGGEYSMDIRDPPEGTVNDLVDLLVFGGIHLACTDYGVTLREKGSTPDWYWKKRRDYWEKRRLRSTKTTTRSHDPVRRRKKPVGPTP
jgi:hypothetical protein